MTDLKEQTAQNKLAKKLDIRSYAELIKLGHDCIEQKKFDFALKIFIQAIQLDANGCEAYHGRGRCHYNMENYELALADFNKAIQLNPNFAEVYRGIGFCYKKQNNDELYFEWIKKAAELEDADAQYIMSLNYKYGWGVEKNLELAFEWLNKAVEQGDMDAQYLIALNYHWGWDIEENPELAFQWFKKAAEQGHIEAQYKLADCYFYGKGTDGDSVLGFKWCKKAAEQGNIEAQYELADCYLNGIGIEINPELGFEFLNKLAEQDNIKAQYLLADCYLKGMGIEKNIKLGFELLKKLAEQRDTQAGFKLNDYFSYAEDKLYNYYRHDKEKENLEEELQWFEKKAEQGDINAYYLLVEVYFEGIKVKKNRILALEWLEKSLTQEKSDKYRLVRIFLDFAYGFESDNNEVEISEQKIIDLYIKAAEYGSANACIRLADYYRLGNHVEKNDLLAFEYYEKAFELSGKEGTDIFDKMHYYPDIKSLASLQLSRYYAEGKVVNNNLDKAAFYQQQIDDEIIEKKDSIDFPYKSAYAYQKEEKDYVSKLEGFEKTNYLIDKGRIEETYEYYSEASDFYGEFNEYVEHRIKVNEQAKELKKLNAVLEGKNQQLELEVQEKEAAQKQIEEKNKELNNLIAMFAHNFLGTLQCIRSNAEHDNNAKIHLKTVKMMSGALTAFSIISADDDKLIEQLKQDNTGETNLLQNLANNLALAISQLLSKTNKDKIINLYLNYLRKTNQIEINTTSEELRENREYRKKWQALQHQWEDEFNALFSENVELSSLQTWLADNFFPVQITGFNNCNIRFKEYGITDSIFLVVFMEILVNVLKYMDVSQNQPLILTLDKQDQHYHLICENPSSQETYRGTHKGMDFLKSIARKLNAQFITESNEQQFKTTFIIPAELLD